MQWYKWTEGSGGTTLLLYFAFALVHDSQRIEIVNFTISLALSAGTLMASAGTPYRLVPTHFYPCLNVSETNSNSMRHGHFIVKSSGFLPYSLHSYSAAL